MTDSNSTPNSKFQSMRQWVVDHKLRAVGSLWLSGIAGSIAYNWSQPGMKTSVRIIHARLHAQALTLAALAGAAVVEYYDHKTGAKSERYAKFLPPIDSYSHKD
ncbi:putative hypoxia induced protein [Helianthus annuus]|nr:putative hypoxia induced protein [Helianthus annuus]KAJ0541399.1 putative hypoxia induced protein [Helianthus annuus]KAJ0706479.1 putative hypoxia induced protein [Helianthus annuus]KAJ0752427.1 putative hypoxia induced protein [Helianthus annuus]KAJ0887034.1 putative hypoxia induced protein [Helianthus annuus]